ncbi:MAG TPA: Asd/ArgC dimerization domain-containing protein [Bryobacteraceae bacterium]|nr:Asd/ArgC dimerization domain-containing protein [Bryobacteraceae bacterium]
MHAHRAGARPAIAIVGGESLLGKEVSELMQDAHLAADIRLIASYDTEDTNVLTRGREELAVLTSLQAADLGSARVVILAGSKESSRKAHEQIRGARSAPLVIDLTGGLEERPETRLRAPMAESPQGEPAAFQTEGAIQVIAHPAAIALALFFTQLQKAGTIRRSVVHVFEPVSERGQAGLDELQKQTVALLSLKPLTKDVFDEQVSFNLLTAYGSESPHSLGEIELKIERHLASLLAGSRAPMPSLRLIHAPVFHGYSLSLWVEFEENPGVAAIAQALSSSNIDVRTAEHGPPSNVGAAGQSGITVGAISADRNHPRACWFWVVADNLHIAAENAVEVVREHLE